jgi:potassium-dependent mechanosensitive channel
MVDSTIPSIMFARNPLPPKHPRRNSFLILLIGWVFLLGYPSGLLGQITLNPPNQLLPNHPPQSNGVSQGVRSPQQIPLPPVARTSQQSGPGAAANPQSGFAQSQLGIPTNSAVPTNATVIPATNGSTPAISPAAGPSPVSDSTSITPDAVTTILQQLQTATDLDAAIKQQLLTTYEAVLAELKSRIESEKLTKDFLVAYEAAPTATADAKRRKETPLPSKLFSDGTLEMSSIESLKSYQLDIQGLAQAATDARIRVEAAIVSREAKRKDIPRSLAEDKAVMAKLNEELNLPVPEGLDPRIREANGWLVRSKLLAINERIRRQEQEQRMFDAEAELLPVRKEVLLAEEKFQLARLKEVKDELGKRRENQIAEQKRKLEELIAQSPVEIKALATSLLKRSDDWLQLARKNASLRTETDSSRSELKLWSDRYNIMTERLNKERMRHVTNFNSLVGLMLRKQRNELPDVSQLGQKYYECQTRIRATQTLILELDDWKASSSIADDATGGPIALTNDLSDQFTQSTVREQKRILHALEQRLVDEYRLDANNYSDSLVVLADTHQSTIDQVKKYRSFIDENVLWIRSCEPIGKSELRLLWPSLQWFFDLESWRTVPASLLRDFKNHPWSYAIGIIGFVALSLNLKRFKGHIQLQGAVASKSNCTSFLPTAKVLLDVLLLSSPVALLQLVIGWRLLNDSEGTPFVDAIAMGLIVSARYFFPLEVIRQVCRSGGLAETHFGWSESTTHMLRKNLRWFIDLAVPAVAIVGLLTQFGEAKWENSLGRLTYSLLMSLCFIVLAILFHPKRGVFSDFLSRNAGGWIDRLRFIWYFVVAAGPLALMGLSLMGHHYTSIRLAMHLHTTFITLIGLLMLSNMIRRWLLLRRRLIVVSQARQRLEDARKRDPSSSSSPSTSSSVSAAYTTDAASDLAQINAQTIRLIRSVLVFAAIAAVAFIWSSILPAVSVLETFVLWGDKESAVTLADMLVAVPTMIMTVVAARNLPGLLEIALLQHLPIENAVRYAIASLSRYAILILGIVLTFNSIGVRWETLQWLVAALGVGLGFGLQEIFANFVSGLILLFEQPIRVGDVITIGDTTGHVSRIRMRATTVTNFDQQELVIPNKDLITGRLLNWTLTDSTNRVTIQVGISYMSDPELACSLLREICMSHPNVMHDPEPTAFFEQFGDSTLNITARLFLANLDHRQPTRHDLHRSILQKFAEAGIEISFPQRDLHIRSMPREFSDLIAKRAA